MRKTVIVSIPMTTKPQKKKYCWNDYSLVTTERAVTCPLLSFLECHLTSDDEVKFILVVKSNHYNNWRQRTEEFQAEMTEINKTIGADISFVVIESEFDQKKYVHESLMAEIVEKIEKQTHIIADITYGPKDLPIIIFSALSFAEKFLDCEIEHILYGQGVFNEDGDITQTKICDMAPLYALNSLTNNIVCKDSEEARNILHSIVSL